MDPRALTKVKAAPGPSRRDWLAATLKLGLGIVLIVMAVPAVAGRNPLAAGWIGMVGIVLCLHFGLFELGALAWRKAGFCVEPLMARPLGAASLGEFWGRRWNTAFHQLAHELVFRPMRRRSDIAAATLATFAVSGLVHELVISLPAGGGWGLPTLYFLVQGSGLLFERATWFRSVVARRKWVARIFTMAIVVGPVFYLFHPDFIRNVILPMLQHFGAT